MTGQDEPRDLAALVVPVAAFLRDLQASGRPETTLRAYAIALLRWHRFLWAAGVPWDQATRAEARDFSRWIQVTVKRGRGGDAARAGAVVARAGVPNPVTGKAPPGGGYAPATVTPARPSATAHPRHRHPP